MKSFFKKLSLVLAAAMVITMLPLQSAKAVTKVNLGVDATKAAAGETIELEVGATQKIGFYGVKDYNTAGAKTKAWKTSDASVATVTNAFVTAVAPGTATISFTCTNNGIDYAGTVKVVVKATGTTAQTQGNVSVKQTAYNAIEITFADEAAAKAAVDKTTVERIKTSAKGTFYLNVNATKKQEKNVITVSGLSDEVTYRIVVPGIAKPFELTMSIGPAAALILEYPTVYIGKGQDITGNNVKNPTVTPIVKIVDADGKVTADAVKNVKYNTDKTKNQYATFTPGSGKIKFSNVLGTCYVKASYTFKDASQQSVTLTDEITVSPVEYAAPNLQGFVEQICLTDKKGDKVVYPGNYDFKATLAVGEAKEIAYYFESTEGKKYTGSNVKTTVEVADKIFVTNSTDYKFYFEKDNKDANVISLHEFGSYVTVKGWNEGTERVCLYKQVGASKDNKVDTLVGVIDITVSPEPYVFDMQLSESSLEGFTNGLKTTGEITYELIDQYNQPIAGTVRAKATDGAAVPSISVTPDANANNKGKITCNFTTLGVTTESKDVVLYVVGTEYSETISIAAEAINTSSTDIGYEIVTKSIDVKNKDFATLSTVGDLAVNFKVAKTYDGNQFEYVDFKVTSDDVDETTPTGDAVGTLYLVLSDVDDKLVKADATDVIPTRSNPINVTAGTGWNFDVYDDAATTSPIGENLKVGSFTANLYKTTGTSKGNYDLQFSTEIEIANKMELIQNVNNTYELTISGDKTKATETKTWTTQDEGAYVVTSTAQYEALVKTIVGKLWGWYDEDSDGKAEAGEVDAIANLFAGFEIAEPKYVPGAENNEVFIKTVTIKYPTDSGAIAEQVINVNRKFVH